MKNKIEGFEWFLPLAYKDSVSQCKFEQGDVIYRREAVGKDWGEEKNGIDFLIQVKSPTRAINNSKGDLDVFSSNWNTKIVFEKIYPNQITNNQIIETTQGAFFSFLWKNDESIINSIDLKPCLTSLRPKFINPVFIKSKVPQGSTGFAIITDTVSDLLIAKSNDVQKALKEKYNVYTKEFNCEEAILINALNQDQNSGFSPTLGVELLIIDSQDVIKITDEIKNVLFKGKKDQFNIQTHGLLISN